MTNPEGDEIKENNEETPDSGKKKTPKAKKPKKRPSDFEIIRTILTRTTERKLPYVLKNLGEDSDIFLLCSEEEGGFLYGSSELAISFVEFEDPSLKEIADTILSKIHGLSSPHQIIVNIRDQISELAKTKGESFEVDIQQDDFGSTWTVKTDIRGQERTLYYSRAIDSLFHFEQVRGWCDNYRFLLKTHNEKKQIIIPYTHPPGDTYTILTIPPFEDTSHPISQLYPNGFRTSVTRGLDLLITKGFVEQFPYPVLKEEIIFFVDSGCTVQMAHRVIGEGWRMVLLRPNAVFFPAANGPIPDSGHHEL